MKKLYLMRHAKSIWDNTELNDFDRPLNKHGRKDTHLMAEFLQTQAVTLDLILSSPAKRAITTANILAESLHMPVKHISSDPRIYEAGVETLLEVLADIDAAHQHVLLLGHDPGLSWLASYLGNEEHVSLPTCGIYGLQVKAESWKSLNKAEIKKLFFEFPTDLHDPT